MIQAISWKVFEGIKEYFSPANYRNYSSIYADGSVEDFLRYDQVVFLSDKRFPPAFPLGEYEIEVPGFGEPCKMHCAFVNGKFEGILAAEREFDEYYAERRDDFERQISLTEADEKRHHNYLWYYLINAQNCLEICHECFKCDKKIIDPILGKETTMIDAYYAIQRMICDCMNIVYTLQQNQTSKQSNL